MISISNPEALYDAILQRRSMGLSRLKPDPVDRALIEQMLEAANWAPSHGDTEPWRFTVFAGAGRAVLAELYAAAQGRRRRAQSSVPPARRRSQTGIRRAGLDFHRHGAGTQSRRLVGHVH